MTEQTVITVNIHLDGTGNNRRVDRVKGQETNVVRLGDLMKADFQFDVSRKDLGPSYGESFDDVKNGKIGDQNAFTEFAQTKHSSSTTVNAYYQGVGAQEEDSWQREYDGATGNGANDRVNYFAEVVKKLQEANPDAVIKINLVGFSRGSAEEKALLQEFASQDYSQVQINKVAIFDTVSAMGNPLSPAHHGMEMDYPQASLNLDPKNVAEFVSEGENRKPFPATMYQQEGVTTVYLPIAHAQNGGGYANDLLSYVSLAIAYHHFGRDGSVELNPLTLEQSISIVFCQAILESPYLTRAFKIDSRIKHTDALKKENVTFEGEVPQQYDYDVATDARISIDERQVNDDSEVVSFVKELFSGITEMFHEKVPDEREVAFAARNATLGSNFLGLGSELFAAALMAGALSAETSEAAEHRPAPNADLLPMDATVADDYALTLTAM